jgi:pimeloyl-ACP methyl ester carboxylesterase
VTIQDSSNPAESSRPITRSPGIPAQPVWFGEDPVFGWFHRAALPSRDCVVILCNPFGYDTMITHYSYRHLAERLAAAGIAVLRFDYFGTGDSAGDDAAPDRVNAWLQSIDEARHFARRVSGASSTALFGLRLGGLLALAAAQTAPVDDLILLGPPASGRAYVRELRALRMLQPSIGAAPSKRSDSEPKGVSDDENFGFLMTAPMREALAAIEPEKHLVRPAAKCLIIPRDDVPGKESALVEHLRACGTEVTASKVAGYSLALRGDPYTCELPNAAWDEIIRWLKAGHSEVEHEPLSLSTLRAASFGDVREEAVRFQSMFGVVTEPKDRERSQSARARTGIILINSGANHRIGNNRMYVRWARDWGALGYRVLRFDLAGIGDSPAPAGRPEKEVYSPRAMPQTRAAIDFMQARGCDRFILAGICSGAYVAFHTAVADPRVVGVALMNPPTFHWNEGDSLELRTRYTFASTQSYARATLSLATWRRAVHGDLHVRAVATELARRALAFGRTTLEDAGVRLGLLSEPDDIARGFKELCGRGAHALLVYGPLDGGIDVIENHLGVSARKMQGNPLFAMKIVPSADHTFTPRAAQEQLRETLTDYLLKSFG